MAQVVFFQPLLHRLPSELLICYAWLLSQVCLRSRDIEIQRFALMGSRTRPDPFERCDKPTASLTDLLLIKLPDPKNEWRIRYLAAQGFLIIRRSFANDSLRNGISLAADLLLQSPIVMGTSEYCRGVPPPVEQSVAIDWLSAANLTSVSFKLR